MKTTFAFCIALVMTLSLSGQDLFTNLTEKYSGREGFSATNLSRDMFDLYLKKKQVEPDSPVYETLKKLNNILVVSQSDYISGKTDDRAAAAVPEIHNAILAHYKNPSYTLFKTENRMGEDLKVYLKKSGEKVNALALVTASPTRVVLVELTGDIDLANVSDLNKALNIRGLENLDRINSPSGSHTLWRFYSDNNFPLNEDQRMQLQQLEEQMKSMKERGSEEIIIQRRELDERQWKMAERFREMADRYREYADRSREYAERSRELAERYGRHPIILSNPGDTNIVYIIDGKKTDVKTMRKLDPDQISTIEVIKSDKNKPGKKGEIRITTKK
ncbi:MAG TPA: DUF4252 domain-containing protein [Prolixibacteraceae bacterium]|jgi:hypothetical protein|nr:DUF4252 domain-containing protein [Bacteroidales bacterium]OQB80388.1 MAG: hypothetical protein BWX87_01444 [Bacteroidetes bacterium ADurb.Bin123]HNZ68435.1 DUF4252 domain-containing protein [Prolixibacteraceae bacterium]HOC86286.1 DUF4252 domain-containing protein [Prolixibacteraceae bacterium]HOG95555.1 DUF4252 domain-containing protein [Prolixibacteraceae bacterium]